MKKWMIIGLIVLFGMPGFMGAQEQDHQALHEEVSVTNIEVPVRVFYKGKAVDDLRKSDFKLYENGKPQAINGFYLERKKIDIQQFELKAKERKEIFPARYFVLVFNLIDYNRNLEHGVDVVFEKVLRETDQLLLMVNKEISFYSDLSEKGEIRDQVKSLLKEKGRISHKRLLSVMNHIERQISEIKSQKADGQRGAKGGSRDLITPFLRDYYFTWQTFKKQYLMPSVDEFYYFANHLEKIKKEKWVINFYQMAKYPQIRDTSSLAGVLKKRLESREFHNVSLELKAETQFPAEQVSRLFYKVNATFHSILIPTQKNILSEDLEFTDISSALENCYREITKKTGGKLVSSADLESALDTIGKKEDICYILTYEPQNPAKTGKIKVDVTGKTLDHEVVYDKNMRASYIKDFLARKAAENPDIKIKEIAFKDKKLRLRIGGFLLKKEKRNKKAAGQVDVHVRIERARARSRSGTPGDHREAGESSQENKMSIHNNTERARARSRSGTPEDHREAGESSQENKMSIHNNTERARARSRSGTPEDHREAGESSQENKMSIHNNTERARADNRAGAKDNGVTIIFDKSKKLNPANTTASVSIDFDWLKKGKYYILTDVRDEFTGNSDLEFVQAVVGETKTTLARVEFKDEDEETAEDHLVSAGGDEELAVYLRGASEYCDRLKQGAFHFFCREKVESILDLSNLAFGPEAERINWSRFRSREMRKTDRMKAGKKQVRVYVFDYQIISSNGRVKEQRKLISKKTGSGEEEKNLQGRITSFLTERAVYGPVTLLSKERQAHFTFKLLKYETRKKRRFAVIEAEPKNKKVDFSYGKIWIDTEDYSILKIKVDPRSIAGYRKLLETARILQTRLFLTCEVEYNKTHNGLRFPTRVRIFETYRGGPIILKANGYKGWERSKTIFTYKDYKFFDVDMSVTHE